MSEEAKNEIYNAIKNAYDVKCRAYDESNAGNVGLAMLIGFPVFLICTLFGMCLALA